jgi:hypothetical protein
MVEEAQIPIRLWRRPSTRNANKQAFAQPFLGNLVLAGAFDRHPKPKVVCAEFDAEGNRRSQLPRDRPRRDAKAQSGKRRQAVSAERIKMAGRERWPAGGSMLRPITPRLHDPNAPICVEGE